MIIVDERGGSHGHDGAMRRLKDIREAGADADLGHLDFGDYGFVGNGPEGDVMVGVELKTVSDLLTSLRSERLAGFQIRGMLKMYQYQWLVAEGMWRHGDRGRFEYFHGGHWQAYNHGSHREYLQWDAFQAWLIGLVQPPRLGYWHTLTRAETAAWVKALHDWWSKPYDEHSAYKGIYIAPPNFASFDPPSDFVRMISTIDKLGWTRAMAIEKFIMDGCLTPMEDGDKAACLIAMTPKQLAEIDGIGKGIAKTIWRAFHAQQ